MSFRIDHVTESAGIWRWQIKGINGRGIYGTLATGPGGHGLYHVSMGARITLIIPGRFCAPPTLPRAEANLLLALALEGMGWGPEVDQVNALSSSG